MSPIIIKPRDPREPRGGWAPGGYMCRCCECGEHFTGDKRAVCCADCAYRIHAPASAEATGGGVAVPLGAIVNGNTFADRVEANDFECIAGPLSNNTDWHEFRRCFNHLADWAQSFAAPEPPAAPVPPAQGWRDISTAPKDAHRILLAWAPFGGIGEHVELGRWSARNNGWVNTYGKPFGGKEPDAWAPLAPFPARITAAIEPAPAEGGA